jgi:hypothetical protein
VRFRLVRRSGLLGRRWNECVGTPRRAGRSGARTRRSRAAACTGSRPNRGTRPRYLTRSARVQVLFSAWASATACRAARLASSSGGGGPHQRATDATGTPSVRVSLSTQPACSCVTSSAHSLLLRRCRRACLGVSTTRGFCNAFAAGTGSSATPSDELAVRGGTFCLGHASGRVLSTARTSLMAWRSTVGLAVPPSGSPHATMTSVPSTAYCSSTVASEDQPPTFTV